MKETTNFLTKYSRKLYLFPLIQVHVTKFKNFHFALNNPWRYPFTVSAVLQTCSLPNNLKAFLIILLKEGNLRRNTLRKQKSYAVKSLLRTYCFIDIMAIERFANRKPTSLPNWLAILCLIEKQYFYKVK